MVLHDYARALRRRWRVAVLILSLIILGSGCVSIVLPKQYTATTEIFFAVSGQSVSDLAQGSTFTERQMTSYRQVVQSAYILEPVVERLGLPDSPAALARRTRATVPTDSVILELSVVERDPQRAALVANAIAEEFARSIGQLNPAIKGESLEVEATILARAQPPTEPSSPNLALNLGAAAALGLAAAVAVAIWRDRVGNRIRHVAHLSAVSDLPTLGAIPRDVELSRNAVHPDRSAAAVAAINNVADSLRFLRSSRQPIAVEFCATTPQEGTTTVAVAVAAALAGQGARVVIVDANLRSPGVSKAAAIDGSKGLVEVLIGEAEISSAVVTHPTTHLAILPAGRRVPDPDRLLRSDSFVGLIDALKRDHDFVLIDTPGVRDWDDALAVGAAVDNTVLVVGANRVRPPQVKAALAQLSEHDADPYGLVLNRINRGSDAVQ